MKKTRQYELVSEALYWLVKHQRLQPGLDELSAHVGLSPSHLQRTFQDLAGVSPKQFLKYLTKEAALQRLRRGSSVMEAAFDCGLSGTGRLHDLIVTTEALTPGEARLCGRGVDMGYGYGLTPFGDALLAWTSRGITFLAFCHEKGRRHALRELAGQWSGASLRHEPEAARNYLQRVFSIDHHEPLNLWLRGSPFQLKVWEALMAIPPGTHCTYGQIARGLNKPRASRAVGSAVGRNPVSWLIPCHRVITSMGAMGGYRWGIPTKMALIGYESARASA